MRCMIRLTAALTLSLTVSLNAQDTFDVASVKKSDPSDFSDLIPGLFQPPGQWSARRATLLMLLRSAYDLPTDRITGLPPWAQLERFDIGAKADPATPPQQLRVMAQRLLADRFGLRAHWEPRQRQVHTLVVAKASGELGPGLRKASCQRSASNACGEAITRSTGGGLRLQLRDRELSELLIIASARTEIGNPLVDRTGLVGRFDIDLEYGTRPAPGQALELGVPLAAALENQLGIRVERRIENVDILVIDRAAMPEAN